MNLFLLLCLLFNFDGQAEVVRLYQGEPPARVTEYLDVITELSPGQTLEFSDGTQIVIKKLLGQGSQNIIYETADGKALRLPLRPVSRGDSVTSYISGAPQLQANHIPIPEIYDHRPQEFVLTEKLSIDYTLRDLIEEHSDLPDSTRARLEKELSDFATKFKNFDDVGDMHLDQIVYTKEKGWALLDWTQGHVTGRSKNPFAMVIDTMIVDKQIFKTSSSYEKIFHIHDLFAKAMAKARGVPEKIYLEGNPHVNSRRNPAKPKLPETALPKSPKSTIAPGPLCPAFAQILGPNNLIALAGLGIGVGATASVMGLLATPQVREYLVTHYSGDVLCQALGGQWRGDGCLCQGHAFDPLTEECPQ